MKPFAPYLALAFLFLPGLLPCSFLWAQKNLSFQHFPSDHPLAQGMINYITQDRQGMLWLATQQGLLRYDGVSTQTFKHRPFDPNSLPDNDVWAICEDQEEDILWLATMNGLSRFDLRTQQFKNYSYHPDSLISRSRPSAKDITFVTQARNGMLWLGTGGGGLNSFDPATQQFTYYYPDSTTASDSDYNHLGFVGEDANGHIWLGTQADLIRLEPSTGKMHCYLDEIGRIKTNFALTIDQEGKVWAFTDRGSFVYRDDQFHPLPINFEAWSQSSGLGWEEIYPEEVMVDHEGKLWFGGWDRGLFLYDPANQQLSHFMNDPADERTIGHNTINSLYEDKDQRIWIGARGLDRYDAFLQKFQFIPLEKHPINTGFSPINSISRDNNGHLWLCSIGNGLTRFHLESQEQASFFLEKPGLGRNYTRTAIEMPDGQIWGQNWWGGVWTFDPQSGQFGPFPPLEGLSHPVERFWPLNKEVIALRVDNKVFLYDLSKDQISEFPFSFNNFTSDFPSLPTFIQDAKGFFWMGFKEDGLIRYDPKTQNHVQFLFDPKNPKSISSNMVYSLFGDSQGNVWVGTDGNGLNLLVWPENEEEPYFRHWFEDSSGLLSNRILDMQEDEEKHIWICTDKGISRFNPVTETFLNFDLQQCGQGFFWPGASHKGADGTLYFGGLAGLTIFHPQNIPINKNAPGVNLTELKIDNEEVSIGDGVLKQAIHFTEKLVLQHFQNDFTLSFAAADFTQPKNNQFQYRLHNYQEQWINVDGIRPEANYTNIPPGQYVFQVRAANPDGIWNTTGKSLPITIKPAWWQTSWAYAIYSFLILLLGYLLYRFLLNRRLEKEEARRLKGLDEARARLYTNITHEFRTPLTIILGITDQMGGQLSEYARKNLEVIKRNGRNLLQLVNQLLDLSRLEAGKMGLQEEQSDIVQYLRYLVASYQPWARQKDIKLTFYSTAAQFFMDFDPKRLEQILANLLSNAIKFTPEGGRVFVKIPHAERTARELTIVVEDTGIGLAKEQLPHIFDRFYQADGSSTRAGEGSGIGLAMVKELVQLMGGKIKANSQLGEGTTFTLTLPVRRLKELSTETKTNRETPQTISSELAPPIPSIRKAELPLVLIIEDNLDLLRMLSNSLDTYYRIFTAQNGKEGLEKALSLIPDLIITDVMMPEKDGFELCDAIKNHELTSHVPVIMLTAKVDVGARLTGLRKGADAYLGKPFHQEELKVRIQTLLDQRRRLQAYYCSVAGISKRNGENRPEAGEIALENAFLQKVNALIEKHLHEETFGAEQLGKALFVSASSLNRKIKALTGLTPIQYIRAFQMTRASKLLTETELTIAEIARQTGFTDQRYFSRIFKKEKGKTPTSYRKSE